MAIIRPFRALRPKPEFVSKVAALPYDVFSVSEARARVSGNKYSFLRVDKPEIELTDKEEHNIRLYEKAKENLGKLLKDVYLEDESPYLYIYQLGKEDKLQTGLVGLTSIDDYVNNIIKKHEHTLKTKEIERVNHVKYTKAHTGPILMTYRKNDEIKKILKNWMSQNSPIYDFKSEDGILQRVWIIDNDEILATLRKLFSKINSLYIADGHHRSAAAVNVGLSMRKENPNWTGDEEFNFFLSVIFPDDELTILDYNRLLRDLGGHTEEEIIDKISQDFKIIYTGDKPLKPRTKNEYGMYLGGYWYLLEGRSEFLDVKNPVEKLDVYILHQYIIKPIFGIKDPRTDTRIDFVGGNRGTQELQKRVDSGEAKVAFCMYPTSINELMDVADKGLTMPPKSTWFEPKLLSGIFIHPIGS